MAALQPDIAAVTLTELALSLSPYQLALGMPPRRAHGTVIAAHWPCFALRGQLLLLLQCSSIVLRRLVAMPDVQMYFS